MKAAKKLTSAMGGGGERMNEGLFKVYLGLPARSAKEEGGGGEGADGEGGRFRNGIRRRRRST